MIGILGGMGTQAGLDICNKIAILHRGKQDQQYPKFLLYNKSYTPKRPENLKKYHNVLKELVKGCKLLEKNKLNLWFNYSIWKINLEPYINEELINSFIIIDWLKIINCKNVYIQFYKIIL